MRLLIFLLLLPLGLFADIYLKCDFFQKENIRYIQISEDTAEINVWDYIYVGQTSLFGSPIYGDNIPKMKYTSYKYLNLQTSEKFYKAQLDTFKGIDDIKMIKLDGDKFIIDRFKGISFHESDKSDKNMIADCQPINLISFKYQVNNLENNAKKTN